MGQNASPIISKLGLTMFWENMWDDKLNFSKKLKEDILINMFLFLIFIGSIYSSNCFYSTSNFYFTNTFCKLIKLENKNYYNNSIKFSNSMQIQFIKPLKLKLKIYYLSKIWILRLQGWLIITFHLYVPQVTKDISFKDSSNIFFKILKKNFKKKYYKKSFILKQKTISSSLHISTFYNWYFINFVKLKTRQIKNNEFFFFY